MNSSILFCFVLVFASVSAAELPAAKLLEDLVEVHKTCSAAHNIKPEELTEIHKYEYLKKLEASEDLKCFSKCLNDKSGVLGDNGYNTERYLEIAAAHKLDASQTQKVIETCKDLYKGKKDCKESWELYVCAHQFQ